MIQTDPRSLAFRVARLGGVVLCAATIAACGGGTTDDPTAADPAADVRDGALKFARCMREHGVDMPDPKADANGRFAITLKGGPNSGNAAADLDQAQKACGKHMEKVAGGPPDAATQAKRRDAMLAHARCMREHGIEMADPEFSTSGGRVTSKIRRKEGGDASQDGPDSPRFQAADKACRPLLGDDGPTMATPATPTTAP